MKLKNLGLFKEIFCLFVVALLSPQTLLSQENILSNRQNIKGVRVDYAETYNSIKSTYSDSVIYYISPNTYSDLRTLYTHNLRGSKNDSLRINKKREYKSFFNTSIYSFNVIKDKYVFVCSDYIYIFKRSKNQLTFVSKLKNIHNFINSSVLGNKILLNVFYNFHPEDAENNHVWALLNIEALLLENVKIKPNDDIIFSPFVNSWFSTYNFKLAHSLSSEYTIRIYNDKLEQIDSIKTQEFDSNKPIVNDLIKVNYHSKDAISNLWELDDSLLTRIRKIYYLNDTTLLALIKMAGKGNVRADYWQKKGSNWIRIHQDYSSDWFIEGQSYSSEKITYQDFYQNAWGFVYLGSYKFSAIYFPFIPIVNTTSFDRNKDCYLPQNNAIKNHETYIGIRETLINFPVY